MRSLFIQHRGNGYGAQAVKLFMARHKPLAAIPAKIRLEKSPKAELLKPPIKLAKANTRRQAVLIALTEYLFTKGA